MRRLGLALMSNWSRQELPSPSGTSITGICIWVMLVRVPRLVQPWAMVAAWAALTMPAPKLWLNEMPAELVYQSLSVGLTLVAERMRISWTSRQPRLALRWSIRATTPETMGTEAEVPP